MTNLLRLPDFHHAKTTLENGLDVIVRREPRLPIVAVNLWYHVGSKNEERRQRGFAHLFEHLMFEGSQHFPGDFFKPLQRVGAAVNGSTSSDRTNYFVDTPTSHVELALAMESDRMGYLIPALDERKLRIQKDVVKNEYRQNYANRPYGMVWQRLAEALYPAGHPYSWMTIGVMEDVEEATREDVEAFFRRFYVPANASLCLVGDIEEDRAFELADRYFGAIPGGARAGRPRVPAAGLDRSEDLRVYDRVELDRVYLNWPTVPIFHPHDAGLALLADVLGRGKTSRLYQKLVVERELSQDVSAFQSARELGGAFGLQTTLRPGRTPEAATELIETEIAAIAREGVTPEELDKVKNGRLSGFFFALESIGGFGGVADRLNAYNVYCGDPSRITTDFLRYENVTGEDVQESAARYLDGRPRVGLTVVGRKPSGQATRPTLDRSQAPARGPSPRFAPPTPVTLTLPGGLPLWVIPRRGLPVVSATLVLDGGAGNQNREQSGLAQLTAAMMDEGTRTRTSRRIAEEVEGMGASLSTSGGWDGSYVSVHCLAPRLESVLDLAMDVLLNPTFPDSEWSRIRGQALAGLQAERDVAEVRASRGLLAALYPPGHPYRQPLSGDEADVSRLTRDDLIQFHQTHHGPRGAAWVIAGDVDPDALALTLESRLDGWAGPNATRPSLPRPHRHDRPRILLIDRPGSVQAAVRAGHVGIRRLDPDFNDAHVLNHVLGGQFNSRLNARLREEKGLTYGIHSHFDFRREAGPFHVSAALQADRLAEALDELRREIQAIREDRPPTQAELDDARRALVEGQARHFETPSALVSRFATLFLHGLPSDHHSRLEERLAAVTVQSLREAADRLINPDAMVTVVVADAAVVLEPLRKLEWAEVTVLDP
ncbi:MAG: M16 family metallopeptidase [Isosphaeraceae bacterium]